MTFSLIGRSQDGTELGVAVASKFLAVGAYVPSAAADAGAIATQARGNMSIRKQGLSLLRQGLSSNEMLKQFLAGDPQKAHRQIGVIDAQGRATTFTGDACMPWAGGQAGQTEQGVYAAQGNMLAGPEVVEAMVASWQQSAGNTSLAKRLLDGLAAGQSAGGDPRGKQAAGLLVVSEGKGYGGLTDVMIDLRCDDSPEPIDELARLLGLHELYFGTTPTDQLLKLDEPLLIEVAALLKKVGFDSGDTRQDLTEWMNRENFEERWHEHQVDPVVLEQLRQRSTL